MYAKIKRLLFGSNDDELGNASAVFDAIAEKSEFGHEYIATLGEPDIIPRGGEYTTDPHVVVPLATKAENSPEPADLEYPLPDGLEDGNSEFFDLLDRFGIEDLSRLGNLEGKNVPLALENGTLVPLWGEVLEPESNQE